MYFVDIDGVEHIGLTYEDERNLATLVMDYLALRWVQGGFNDLLEFIYSTKCSHGGLISTDNLMALIDHCEFWGLMPPKLEDTQYGIWDDLSYISNKRNRILEARKTTIRAWREVWEQHDSHKAVADSYKTFPGDEVRELAEQTNRDLEQERNELEKMFWDEVNKIEQDYQEAGLNPPKRDIITQVADYIPRNPLDLE